MRKAILSLSAILIMSGCATLQPREGPPSWHRWPQATEQCKAQPELAWC